MFLNISTSCHFEQARSSQQSNLLLFALDVVGHCRGLDKLEMSNLRKLDVDG